MKLSTALMSIAGVALLLAGTPAANAGETDAGGGASSVAADENGSSATARPAQWFRNQATGQCLDDSEAYGLRATTCWYNAYQDWYITVWGDGTRELENRKTRECLAVESYWGIEFATTSPCNTSRRQSWYVKDWGDGTIRFRNQATGLCLDHNGNDGVHVRTCNAGQYQSWE